MTLVVGITGGIGSGKSTVARLLGEHGAVVLDADRAAHEALSRPEVIEAVVAAVGADVVRDGAIDRAALAARVFGPGGEGARRRLESIVHPLVRSELQRALARARSERAALVVLDVPLLMESAWRDACDRIVFVRSSPADRAARTAARGWNEGELARREAAQAALADKEAAAHHVIANDGDLDRLRERTAALLRDLL